MIALTVQRQVGGKLNVKKKKDKSTKKHPRSAPSIPSKYHDEARDKTLFESRDTAFLCSTTRFDEKVNANPGPGQYHKRTSYVKDANKCGSVSARGYTSMISLDPRFSNLGELQSQSFPGPATYMPSVAAIKTVSAKIDFSNHRTAGTKRKSKFFATPGPGQYCLGTKSSKLPNNLGAASFKFTARKDSDVLVQQDSHVAVGTYDVAKSLDYIEKLGKEPRKGKAFPDHTFSSTASRLAPITFSETPAPGFYDCEPYPSHEMFRQSSVFNPDLDRFGNSNNVKVLREITPGPDSYYCYDVSKSKSNVYGAVASFSSTSTRFETQSKNDDGPGPQCYRPHHIPRKSFHMNRHCQWI